MSFDVNWAGHGRSTVQTDGRTFSYDSVISSATVAWSGENEGGVHFVADAASTSVSAYAAVGHLKNGSFFRG